MNETAQAVPAPVVAAARPRAGDFLALTKPGITVMVAVTAGLGFLLASAEAVRWGLLLKLLFGTMLSAAGAAALNMFLERRDDAKMERTKDRPLPAGRLSPLAALLFGSTLAACGMTYLALRVNILTASLSALTIVLYLGVYTPLKAKTSLCTLVGAVPGAIPPVMGWTAAREAVEPGAAVLFLLLFFWQLPHFLALAWMYREDYARAGHPMLPVAEPDGASTGRQAALQTLALIVVSALPVGFRLAGELYLVAALVLGTGFLGFALAFAVERSRERARRLFLASIVYLPLLLGALVLL